MKKLFFFVFAIILFTSNACSPDDPIITPPKEEPKDTLPPLTNEGLNTFGCYVDDELWLAESDALIQITTRPIEAFYNESTGFLRLQFKHKKDSIFEFLTIFFDRKAQFESNQLKDTITQFNFFNDKNEMCIDYDLDFSQEYHFTINNIEPTHNIISGEFSGTMIYGNTKEGCQGSLIKIDSARFDVIYQE